MLSSALIRIVKPFNSKSLWDGRVTRGHGWLLSRKGSSWSTNRDRRLTVTSNRPIKDFHSGTRAAHTETSPTGVWIEATPRVCLHDVPTILRAGGLPPNSPVTLHAHLIDENGKQFCSNAHYLSDAGGLVDVRVAESEGGSYTGVFPEGLLTTLAPAPHELFSLRLYRRNPQLPWKIRVGVLKGHEPLESQSVALAEVELERHLMGPGVRRVPVREGRVRGVLYLPPGPGPFPGIVDMFGSIGGIMEFRSAMLASRGFASLALPFFLYDDLPKTTDRLDLDYFEDAVKFLLSQPQVIPDRCGTVAISKSGDLVFTMGTLFEPVKAVVGISSCIIAFHSAFYYKGELFMQGDDLQMDKLDQDSYGAIYGDMKELFDPDNPKMIPVEEADDETHFLVAVGDDDPWGFRHSLPAFRERMLRNNRRNFETVLYPGAGHIIEPPYGPVIRSAFQRHFPSNDKSESVAKGVVMKWGGYPEGTCKAQVDLWHRIQTFFMNHVRDESPWYQQYLHDQSR